LLKSKKAQFFILSAFAIVSILYLVSRWIEPYTIIDTSEMVLNEELFVFNNIIEKIKKTVDISINCEEYKLNIDEYRNFVTDYASKKNLRLNFDRQIIEPCNDNILETKFNITLTSEKMILNKEFTYRKSS